MPWLLSNWDEVNCAPPRVSPRGMAPVSADRPARRDGAGWLGLQVGCDLWWRRADCADSQVW